MIGKPYFLLTLLQAVVSQEWRVDYKPDVTVQRGLCARIPCRYHYPSYLVNKPRVGIWRYNKIIVFHSGGPSRAWARFRHRTRLSGDLRDADCSLVINDITQEDDGPYYFRVEFDGSDRFNFPPGTQLHVSDFTDKPSIFPIEMVAGEPVNVICTFNTTCDGTAPTLTWVTPADVPPAAPSNVTRRGDTLTYTSVLTLTPALKHHGQNLTCRVTYPSVSSEQTLTLTVEYAPVNLSVSSPDNVDNSSIGIKEGNSVAILCSVQSFPASNLTWRHRGVTLNRTRSRNELWLEFPQMTPGLAGVYQCVAENEHGTAERAITLTVESQQRRPKGLCRRIRVKWCRDPAGRGDKRTNANSNIIQDTRAEKPPCSLADSEPVIFIVHLAEIPWLQEQVRGWGSCGERLPS